MNDNSEVVEIMDSPPHVTATVSDEVILKQSTACPTPKSSMLVDFFKERSMKFKEKELKEKEKIKTSSTAPEIPSQLKQHFPLVVPRNRMAQKIRSAAPYNFFLTSITSSRSTHSDEHFVTFQEILDPSLGDLVSSIQINFTVDFEWLLGQYKIAGVDHLPLLVLFGQGYNEHLTKTRRGNISTKMIEISTPFGCHHTKMMILMYKDKSVRVVISTANLYNHDWDNRVQGLWISEKLQHLDDASGGESVTEFRKDLIEYLGNYKLDELKPAMEQMMRCDFSSIKVFLITSVPGEHHSGKYGLKRIAKIIPKNLDEKCPLVIQSSSLGSFGKQPSNYLTGDVLKSFGGDGVKIIYPSLENVEGSYDGLNLRGCGCMLYQQSAHNKQKWLNDFLHQWKSEDCNCTRAMPHIKTYSRFTEDRLYWFILASHNISKSAWGSSWMGKFSINSYEVGVAFLPQTILNGQKYFPLKSNKDNTPVFKLPFDTDLQPYEADDVPFCIDYATNL